MKWQILYIDITIINPIHFQDNFMQFTAFLNEIRKFELQYSVETQQREFSMWSNFLIVPVPGCIESCLGAIFWLFLYQGVLNRVWDPFLLQISNTFISLWFNNNLGESVNYHNLSISNTYLKRYCKNTQSHTFNLKPMFWALIYKKLSNLNDA